MSNIYIYIFYFINIVLIISDRKCPISQNLNLLPLIFRARIILSWILDAEIHLDAMNLGNTIKGENTASLQNRVKALIFLRHHIDEGLKSEYLTVKYPLILLTSLK